MSSTRSGIAPGTTIPVFQATATSSGSAWGTLRLSSMWARRPGQRATLHSFRCATGWWHIDRTGDQWKARLFRDMASDPNPMPTFQFWRWWP